MTRGPKHSKKKAPKERVAAALERERENRRRRARGDEPSIFGNFLPHDWHTPPPMAPPNIIVNDEMVRELDMRRAQDARRWHETIARACVVREVVVHDDPPFHGEVTCVWHDRRYAYQVGAREVRSYEARIIEAIRHIANRISHEHRCGPDPACERCGEPAQMVIDAGAKVVGGTGSSGGPSRGDPERFACLHHFGSIMDSTGAEVRARRELGSVPRNIEAEAQARLDLYDEETKRLVARLKHAGLTVIRLSWILSRSQAQREHLGVWLDAHIEQNAPALAELERPDWMRGAVAN